MTLTKYISIAKTSWSNGFVYRLNFLMYRVGMVIQLAAVYFLWGAISQNNQTPFGYQQSILITYILASSIMRAIVFSSKSIDAQTEIATGDLSNYLVKPVNYFGLWFFRDIADKALNIIFSLVEISLLILVLKPNIFIQTNPVNILSFIVLTLLAIIMYFFFSFIISMTTFWYSESNGWPQRFLALTLLEFLAGGLFPLDILPLSVFSIVKYLPTTYFIYMPIQAYLGGITLHQSIGSVGIMVLWIMVFAIFCRWMWQKGIKKYESYGR